MGKLSLIWLSSGDKQEYEHYKEINRVGWISATNNCLRTEKTENGEWLMGISFFLGCWKNWNYVAVMAIQHCDFG